MTVLVSRFHKHFISIKSECYFNSVVNSIVKRFLLKATHFKAKLAGIWNIRSGEYISWETNGISKKIIYS